MVLNNSILTKLIKTRNYCSRSVEEFNIYRKIFQYIASQYFILWGVKSKYNVKKVVGLENIDRSKKYIIASNHISGFDPFFLLTQIKMSIAYMAKKELFETFWSMLLMDFCGAFAVDRDNVSTSTIKTALSIKKTDWNLGIFPQGKRSNNGKLENITKGFAILSKKMKLDIIPIAILVEDNQKTQKQDITVIVNQIISHQLSVDEIVQQWCKIISQKAKLKYD